MLRTTVWFPRHEYQFDTRTVVLLRQVNAAASIVQANVHPDANIIVGALVDERCGNQVSVTVLATGFGVRCGRAEPMQGPVRKMPEFLHFYCKSAISPPRLPTVSK